MKKLLAIILIISLILPTTFIGYANEKTNYKEFSDIKGHWAEQTIEKHHEMGMLSGYPDGTFKPDQQIKRCELITLVNKYFGLKEEDNQNFEDVEGKAWYANETAKAKYYGYIKDLEARPEVLATREDVVNMLSLIIDVEEQRQIGEEKTFKDLKAIDEKTKEKIDKFSEMGYISGYEDGTFKPKEIINRAEIMTIIENVLGYIVTSQEDINNMPEDVTKVTIINSNIIIEDKEIKGDLYVSAGVKGSITIKNSKIKGQIDVSGGSIQNPINLENVTAEKVVITKAKNEPRLEIKGHSKIGQIKTKTKTSIVVSGDIKIKEIDIKGKTTLDLGEGTKVGKLVIEKETKVNTEKGSKIENLEAKGKTEIKGEGKIEKAYVKNEEVKIEQTPDYVEVDKNAGTVKIGDKDMNHENDNTNEQSNNKNNSSGGSTSSDTTAPTIDIKAETGDKEGEIKLNIGLNEAGNVYYMIVKEESIPPKNGQAIKDGGQKINIPIANKEYTKIIGALTAGESYTIYFVAEDNKGNLGTMVSKTAKANDTSSPQWVAGYPYAQRIDDGPIKLYTRLDEPSTVYYKVYEAVDGQDFKFSINEIISSGNQFYVNKANTVVEEVYNDGLVPTKSYNVYLLAEDQLHNKQETIKEIEVENKDTKAPIFTEGPAVETGENKGEIKITASINEKGKIYCIVAENGSMAPNIKQIKDGMSYEGATVKVQVTGERFKEIVIDQLIEGKSYDIYFVAEDEKGNTTDILKKTATAKQI